MVTTQRPSLPSK